MNSGNLITPTSRLFKVSLIPFNSSCLLGTMFDKKNKFEITKPKSLAKI